MTTAKLRIVTLLHIWTRLAPVAHLWRVGLERRCVRLADVEQHGTLLRATPWLGLASCFCLPASAVRFTILRLGEDIIDEEVIVIHGSHVRRALGPSASLMR